MEEIRSDLAETIEKFDFLLQTCQERLLGEFFSHLLKTNRINVDSLLLGLKSALLAHDAKLITIVKAIEAVETSEAKAANAVVPKGGNS